MLIASTLARLLVLVASLAALALLRGRLGAGVPALEVPALGASPALELRLFYGGLLLAAAVSLLSGAGEVALYLVTALLFGGSPVLGHQTIGLTPARGRSAAIRRPWLLGLMFPVLVLVLGAAIVAGRMR